METEQIKPNKNQEPQLGFQVLDQRPLTTANIICPLCSISFNPSISRTNICINCLTNNSDVADGIMKQGVINFCRMCKRYLRPPWVIIERESKEMLSLCLKKIKGLNKVKLVDANFIWTEPHCRRIKVKVTIQKEIMNNASVQQSFVVEFEEHYMQCDDCKKEFTPHTWTASVQLRQKVQHKKTFFWLEQLILKNSLHDKVLNIEAKDEGLDFFFKGKNHASRLVDYLQSILPCIVKPSKQLISHDERNNIFNYKFTWSVEIPRICRDDLVILPAKLSKDLGGCGQLLLCIKISTVIHFIDPYSMKRVDLNSQQFFHYESDIQIISLKNNITEFLVMDIEKPKQQDLNSSYMSSTSNIYMDKVCDITVARTSDWNQFNVKTHLGNRLKINFSVDGYDLTTVNFSEDIDQIRRAPEIVLVKKTIDKEARAKRIWKLRHLEKDGIMVDEEGKKKRKDSNDQQGDYQEFMDDVERYPEMRQHMNLYRDEEKIKKLSKKELERKAREKSKLSKKQIQEMQEQRKILKVKSAIKNEKNSSILKDEEEEKKVDVKKNVVEDDEDEDDNEVKLFELLAELNINDDDDGKDVDVEQQQEIDDFIQKLDKVQIEGKDAK